MNRNTVKLSSIICHNRFKKYIEPRAQPNEESPYSVKTINYFESKCAEFSSPMSQKAEQSYRQLKFAFEFDSDNVNPIGSKCKWINYEHV